MLVENVTILAQMFTGFVASQTSWDVCGMLFIAFPDPSKAVRFCLAAQVCWACYTIMKRLAHVTHIVLYCTLYSYCALLHTLLILCFIAHFTRIVLYCTHYSYWVDSGFPKSVSRRSGWYGNMGWSHRTCPSFRVVY